MKFLSSTCHPFWTNVNQLLSVINLGSPMFQSGTWWALSPVIFTLLAITCTKFLHKLWGQVTVCLSSGRFVLWYALIAPFPATFIQILFCFFGVMDVGNSFPCLPWFPSDKPDLCASRVLICMVADHWFLFFFVCPSHRFSQDVPLFAALGYLKYW